MDAYNTGYGDGYHRRMPVSPSEHEALYYRAYITGAEDRLEDEEAIASGTFDLLNKEERRVIYGDEHDRV